MKKKIILCVLLLAWMGVIFYFSAQDKTASANLSSNFLSRFILFFLPDKISGNANLVHTLEFLLRKAAHMTEYAILCILFSSLLKSCLAWDFPAKTRGPGKSGTSDVPATPGEQGSLFRNGPGGFLHVPYLQLFLSVAFVFFYACTDEFHQTFVPGRSGQFRDVLIDTLGGLLGGLFFILSAAAYARVSSLRNHFPTDDKTPSR